MRFMEIAYSDGQYYMWEISAMEAAAPPSGRVIVTLSDEDYTAWDAHATEAAKWNERMKKWCNEAYAQQQKEP